MTLYIENLSPPWTPQLQWPNATGWQNRRLSLLKKPLVFSFNSASSLPINEPFPKEADARTNLRQPYLSQNTVPLIDEVEAHTDLPQPNLIWAAIVQWYIVYEPDLVSGFVRQRPAITKILLDAIDIIPDYFGSNANVFLELVNDTEFGDDKQIFAYIRTSMSAKDAGQQLEQFDNDWFLQRIDQVDGEFNFNLQFV